MAGVTAGSQGLCPSHYVCVRRTEGLGVRFISSFSSWESLSGEDRQRHDRMVMHVVINDECIFKHVYFIFLHE